MTPTTQLRPRLGIAIPLDELKQAMNDYLTERSDSNDLLPMLLLSDFLGWLRQQQQKENDDGSRTNR